MKFSIIYISTVVLINMAFTYIPPIELYDGTIWSVGSIIAGLVFIARDYAQREVGHKVVLLLMVGAGVVSYIMSSPFVAIASVVAFAASELVDYAVYTTHKGTFKQRVILSSLVSVPVDTVIFLAIISHLSLFSFVAMCLSKLVVVVYVASKKQ